MTVHGAKGLQAPIVFLADSASTEQSPHENIFWDEKNNLIFSCYSEFDCKRTKQVKEYINSGQQEENLRLLYVALTRAEDELYVAGWDNNRMKGSWYDIILNSFAKEEGNPNFANDDVKPQSLNDLEGFIPHHEVSLNKKKLLKPSLVKGNNPKSIFMERGKLIHKLLHELPLVPQNKWDKLLANYDPKIKDEVLANISKFPDIFMNPNSVAEAPISGLINSIQIHAQVDKIIFANDEIKIIDFKTDTNPDLDNLNESYLQQLKIYKLLLRKKYPHRNIRTYLLFSVNQKFIEILN
jgi:ATP-dependent helicase/nuclease subunit A